MSELKENQWYRFPGGEWGRASRTNQPAGIDPDPNPDPWSFEVWEVIDGRWQQVIREIDSIMLLAFAFFPSADWTVADLHEATPDEAEEMTYRCLLGR